MNRVAISVEHALGAVRMDIPETIVILRASLDITAKTVLGFVL